jgi:hypothetical protein
MRLVSCLRIRKDTIAEPTTATPTLYYELTARSDGSIVAELAGILMVEKDPNLSLGEPAAVAPEPTDKHLTQLASSKLNRL